MVMWDKAIQVGKAGPSPPVAFILWDPSVSTMGDDPCQQVSITWLAVPSPQEWSMAGPNLCVVSTVGRVVSSAHPGQLLVSPYTASILDTMTTLLLNY